MSAQHIPLSLSIVQGALVSLKPFLVHFLISYYSKSTNWYNYDKNDWKHVDLEPEDFRIYNLPRNRLPMCLWY